MDFYKFNTDTDDYRTTVYGFPCLVFHEKSTGEFEFIGKYNFNLDKSSEDFGQTINLASTFVRESKLFVVMQLVEGLLE